MTETTCTMAYTDGLYTKGTRSHTHRELIYGGASRASKGQETL